MQPNFFSFRGARLINVIATFLIKKGLNPIPLIFPLQKKIIYDDSNIVISFACTTDNHGYYEVIQKNEHGFTYITKTNVFFFYKRRYY